MGLFDKKLKTVETQALIAFWRTYMAARRSYEDYQQATGNNLDYKRWQQYLDQKMDAFKKCRDVIPEIRYIEFWRDATGLRPQAIVDNIIQYRHNREVEQQQRATERAILSGAPSNTVRI